MRQKPLKDTYNEVMAQECVDLVIVVDDASVDDTSRIAGGLSGVLVYKMSDNVGYGGNQKKCYRLALEHGADIIIMVHPDYQYTPKLIPAHGLDDWQQPLLLRHRVRGF